MNHPHADFAETDERAIDQTLSQWVLGRTGSALLANAARMASTAEGHGHSCAWLSDPQAAMAFDDAALAALRQHEWVGDGSRFTPFVLDARNRFYLWRNWQHESKLAELILHRCERRRPPISTELLAQHLDTLFEGMPVDFVRLQRAAVAAIAGKSLFVLTGGPGTGKTTTVVRMLLMLLQYAEACGLPPHPSIALAAPTGKAAQRLAQAVAKGKIELQLSAIGRHDPCAMQDTLSLIPHAEARTLHRLLGYRPTDNHFGHGPGNPLAEDIVVVDEASMVDLAMMRQLLEALRPDAVLILLGDPHQLASVDAGSVLADIVASAPTNECLQEGDPFPASEIGAAAVSGHVVTLVHGWRAGSGLQSSIEALRDSSHDIWLDALLQKRADGDLRLLNCANSGDLEKNVDDWVEGKHRTLQALLSPGVDAAKALAQLRQFQILCALRDGPYGAQGINLLVARRLSVRFGIDVSHDWYHGRPVIVTRNDYSRGLFNGDVGIALRDTTGMRVWFELVDRHGGVGLRSFSPRALPAHESAWAITIHRSQGSEYQDVAVVLPSNQDTPILTRELIYTAISRASISTEIWSTDASLRSALVRRFQRQGGLRDRLRKPRI